jgi:transposase-like protein
MLSERRNLAPARRFLKRAISKNCVPDRVVIDKSGANLAGRQSVNVSLKFTASGRVAEVRQIKYYNNIGTGSPLHQAYHSADDGLQGVPFRHRDSGED